MDNVKVLLEQWKEDGLANPDALLVAYDAIVLLIAKVEELEAQVQALSE
jgi:hypothetical protein